VLKVSQVYEKQVKQHHERPDGTESVQYQQVYDTREVLLNPDYVVSISPHEFSSDRDVRRLEGQFPEGTRFSSLVLDGNSFRSSELVVVGSFDKFCRLLETTTS
jgi:hypothetical protein